VSKLCTTCLIVYFTASHWQCVFAQSDNLPNSTASVATDEPQVSLRLRFFEFVRTPENELAIKELCDGSTELHPASAKVRSQTIHECVKNTIEIGRILDDLCKAGHGKILSDSEVALTPGVQSQFRSGQEVDLSKLPPKQNKIIQVSETVKPDTKTERPAEKSSVRFVGTTISSTASIVSDENVNLEFNAQYARLNIDSKTKLAGLNTSQFGVHVVLAPDQSLILGPSRSSHTQASEKKVPVLGSIPGIGGVFKTETQETVESELFVIATTEIINP
jgi:Flp pilus assembly secretin CpaC